MLGIFVVSILAKQITLLVGVGIFSPFQHDVFCLTSVTSEIQYACWLVTNRRHDGFDDHGTDAKFASDGTRIARIVGASRANPEKSLYVELCGFFASEKQRGDLTAEGMAKKDRGMVNSESEVFFDGFDGQRIILRS